jgi:hypothetical protein
MTNYTEIMTNYTEMTSGELYHSLGCDAAKWAQAFCQMHPKSGLDEGVMIGWFANAMMAQVDFQGGRQPILCGDHAQWLIDRGESA